MKTAQEKISLALKVSPEQAWQVIGAVGGVDQWFASMIKTCKVENGRRFCETTDGQQLTEEILEVDHASRTFRFAIPQQELLPVENIVETMTVKAGDNGQAVVEWSATFDTTDENEATAKEMFRNLWTMGLQEMEAFIQQN